MLNPAACDRMFLNKFHSQGISFHHEVKVLAHIIYKLSSNSKVFNLQFMSHRQLYLCKYLFYFPV